MLKLELVNEESFSQVLNLSVSEKQKGFVAANVRSLAEAWLYRENGDVFPYAIYADDKVVGFLLLEKDFEDGFFLIWRLMIDETYQGLGHGRATIQTVIDWAKTTDGIYQVKAYYVKENDQMSYLLEQLGFTQIGQDE